MLCLMYTLTLCVVCHWYFYTLHYISCSHIITFVKRWTVLRQDFVFSKVAWADICSFFTHYTNGGRMTSLSISLVSVFILLSQEPTFTQLLHFQYIAHCQYCLLSTYLHSGSTVKIILFYRVMDSFEPLVILIKRRKRTLIHEQNYALRTIIKSLA